MEVLNNLLNNEYFVWCAMGLIAFLVTQILKLLLVKPFTKNLNKRAKTLINSVILLIAFGSAVICEWFYSHYWLGVYMDLCRASNGWAYASSIYAIVEVFIKVIKGDNTLKLENPYSTEEGKAVTNMIGSIVENGKVDENDKKAVDDFLKMIK